MAEGFAIALAQEAARSGRIHWHQHALERMLERGITRCEVIDTIVHGEVIETYPADRPFASCLLLHVANRLHVVASVDPQSRICHVITAYRPDKEHFAEDLRTRRTS